MRPTFKTKLSYQEIKQSTENWVTVAIEVVLRPRPTYVQLMNY